MDTLTIRRMAVNGAKSFMRSGSVSFATVLIMTVTLGIIGILIFLTAVLSYSLDAIKDKVDVNIYFTTTAAESDIMAFETKLAALPDVERVSYTSRDDALTQFKARHQDDALTLAALEELGDNPLGASLAVKAKDPSQYQEVVTYITDNTPVDAGGASIVDRVNYFENKSVIDRLAGAIRSIETAGAVIVFLFALASATIAFATVRLAIYTTRDEIGVMRLIGASNMFIRGPFIVAGALAGLIASIIILVLFYPVAWYVGSATTEWLGGFSVFTYYTSHFALFFAILVGAGVFLGGIASWIAVRRYLKI